MNILKLKSFSYPDKTQTIILASFLILGVSIRLFHFLDNRSLWLDEVYLSTSIIKMNIWDLITKPLYYQQKAPLGFLVLVKSCTSIFGYKEMSLRLIPLISGLLSLFIFIPLAKFYLKNWASLIAIGILCLSPALIYHSVEIKQYGTELLGTLLCLHLMIRFRDNHTFSGFFAWGFYGALVLWFSYSSIFILGGIGIGLGISYLLKKKWNLFVFTLIPSSIWVLSFLCNYFFFTHKHAESEWIAYWFRAYHNFMPFPPKSIEDLKWFARNMYRMTDYPLGLLWNFNNIVNNTGLSVVLKMSFLPIGLILFGFFVFFKKNFHEMIILTIGLLLMFLASGLELYPLTERFWVFIAPVFIIILAKGFEGISEFIKSKIGTGLLFSILILGPLIQSIAFTVNSNLFYVHKKSYQREALIYINQHFKKGDLVYVYWNDVPGYAVYDNMYEFDYKAIKGSNLRTEAGNFDDYYNKLKPELRQLKSAKRVWMVFNEIYVTDIGDRIDEPKWYYVQHQASQQFILSKLNSRFYISKKFLKKDIAVFLLIPKENIR